MYRTSVEYIRTAAFMLLAAVLAVASAATTQLKANHRSASSQAVAQLGRGDLDAAEETLWKILSADPNDERALTLLGKVRIRQKRHAEAEALFRRVLALNPGSLIAAKDLARTLETLGKLDEAIDEFRRTALLAPRDSSITLELARLYLERDRFSEALSTLEATPGTWLPAEAIPIKVASLLGLGRRSEALRLSSSLKTSFKVTIELARVFLVVGIPEESLAILKRMPPKQQARAEAQYIRGRALQNTGQLASASISFRRVLAVDPKSVESLVAMAEIAGTQNRHDRAFALLKRAKEIDPQSVSVLRAWVIQAMAGRKKTMAVQAAQELQKRSSDPRDSYLVAAVMLETGQVDSAIALLQRYVNQWPQDSRAWLGLGIAHRQRQEYDLAGTELQRALELNPGLNEAEYELGVVASRQGDSKKAISHFERVRHREPRHSRALLELGTLYLQTGILEKARDALLLAQSANPAEPDIEYQLSLLSNRMGKVEEARDHMRHFQQLKRDRDRLREAGDQQTFKATQLF
jgi:tetratricopeptide (TPR) repeat protein